MIGFFFRRPSWKEGLASISLTVGGLAFLFNLPPAALVWALTWAGPPAPLPGHRVERDGTFVAEWDNGGPVVARLALVDRMDRYNVPMHIEGLCASACTLHLTARNVCAGPGSLWMFHPIAFPADRNSPFLWFSQSDSMQQRLTEAALDRFPEPLARWQRSIQTGEERWVAGADLVDAGWIRACPQNFTPALSPANAVRARQEAQARGGIGYGPPLPRATKLLSAASDLAP